MMNPRLSLTLAATVAATLLATTAVTTTSAPADANIRELWEEPTDLAARDLFHGPWGAEHAPDPDATYRFLAPKKGGINPGMTVRDPQGREWKIKQPPDTGRNAEGPVEVVLSRAPSAVGYHQPPVYFLPSLLLDDGQTVRRAGGGRFRLDQPSLND